MTRDDDLIRRGDALYWIDRRYKLNDLRREVESIPAVPREMTAREFAKEFRRMCDSYDIDGRNECDGCKLYAENICSLDELDNIVPIVEQWAKEHPEKKRKTYAEDFKEKFKKAYETNGHPAGCREGIYRGLGCPHKYVSCEVCWNEEMEDEDEYEEGGKR